MLREQSSDPFWSHHIRSSFATPGDALSLIEGQSFSFRFRARLALCVAYLAIVAGTLAHAIPVSAQTGPVPEDLTVSGDAAFAIAPDFTAISARIEQTSATGKEASAALTTRAAKLAEALRTVDASVKTRLRGDKYLPPAPGALALKASAPVTIQRTISIETTELEKVGQLIDTALLSGASVVTEVTSSARSNQRPLLDAIELATKRAREKAELTASALGAKLGAVLSTVVTEEPEGEALRQQLQLGAAVTDYGDRVQHVYVSVRYALTAR